MKTIYLIRHAKSSYGDFNIDDFSRELNKRGKKDVIFMANRLKNFGINPDLILASPAKRAKKTAHKIAKIIDYKKKVQLEESLYNSSYTSYKYLLESLDDNVNSLFIIAHNPTITEFGEIISGAILTNMPACSIVGMEFNINSFKDMKEKSGKILFFDYPKKHNIIN